MATVDLATAVAAIRPEDSLALPLGPGVPGGFLHALGERDDFTRLEVFGALLPDLYQVFMRKGVRYRSGFFGPAERFLRDSGADIDFTSGVNTLRLDAALLEVDSLLVSDMRRSPKRLRAHGTSLRGVTASAVSDCFY